MHQIRLFPKAISRYKATFKRRREYWYLKKELDSVSKDKVVFLGSSYVLFGINKNIENSILALPSQDLYYSYKLLLKCFELGEKPAAIVIGVGYYALYHDLSRSSNQDELLRIESIYKPLLGDFHHYGKREISLMDRARERVIVWLSDIVINKEKEYFDVGNRREENARVTWQGKDVRWQQLCPQEKIDAAKKRVSGHERFLKYEDTFIENDKVLNSIELLCRLHNVPLLSFIAPMSDEYNLAMSDVYRQQGEYLKRRLENETSFLGDLNMSTKFRNSNYYVDADHMSDAGAICLSNYLNSEMERVLKTNK